MKKMIVPDKNKMIPVAVTVYNETLALLYALPLATKTKLFLFTAADGVTFSLAHEITLLTASGKPDPLTHYENIHVTNDGDVYYLVYTRTVRKKPECVIASSSDAKTFRAIGKTNLIAEPIAIVPDHVYKDHFIAYIGNDSVRAAATKDFNEWHITSPLLDRRNGEFDEAAMRVIGAVAINTGILVTYDATDYKKTSNHLMIGAALFSYDQPYKTTWRSPFPVWETTTQKGNIPAVSLGTVMIGGHIRHYWRTQKNKVISVALPVSMFSPQPVEPAILLARHEGNPIITPNACNHWECEATFNPAAIYLNDKVHLLYRAIGSNGISYIGYASSDDGLHFTSRLNTPVYTAQEHYAKIKAKQEPYKNAYMSGGSWSGCEDPRIVKIDDTLYMTYTSFNGYNPPGMSLTSIAVSDFLAQRWNWTEPILISKPEDIQKNWVMFPETINGKYAFLHSINPIIRIDYFDSPMHAEMAIESPFSNKGDRTRWDNLMRGAATPPLRTKEGWLVLYHAMDKRDPNRYKLGAMLLDYADPTKIVYRSGTPVLEPNEWYENEGAKRGVIFACGSVIKDNTLFVYYGGADSVACVATAPLDTFLKEIMSGPQQDDFEIPLQTACITITKLA